MNKMETARVTTKDTNLRRQNRKKAWYKRWWLWLIVVPVIIASVLTPFKIIEATRTPSEPPETDKILKAQESMGNFGILIPGYLPQEFKRAGVEVNVVPGGPTKGPSVDLVYRGKEDTAIFLHQWVPVRPEMETLSGSRPVETKWGKGYLLTQKDTLICVWVDVGPLRVSVSTHNVELITREQLVLMANTLGLASNLQAYSFITEIPLVQDVAPPPPFEVKINNQGVQELNLTITPGGYSPMRFAVKKDIPVKINFRALGEVGCGDTLIFPVEGGNSLSAQITKEKPLQVLEFTPHTVGVVNFNCTTQCFQGVMTVMQ
jgi:hypothetical protein